jgi:hypothetical protein
MCTSFLNSPQAGNYAVWGFRACVSHHPPCRK